MLVDPGNNFWCVGPRRKLYAYEVCDAVEQETFTLDGLAMSDSLYPPYFENIRRSK